MAKIDDSVKKKVPELRFKGFTDEWEERKFADFIDVKSGKDYKHLNSGSIPVYGTGGYMLSVDRALSDIDAIGIGRKGTIDKPYLLKAPFWTVDTLFYAVPKQNIDLQFSLSIFKKINWKKFDESTGVPSLSKTVINSVSVSVPSYEEQQKIGSFFKQLDDTIALHQRKLDLLKEQKKGFLQKMFPKNGAKVPELRFAGFADDWEERKLSEGTSKIGDGLHGTPNYSDNGDVFFINGNNLVNGKIVITKETKLVTESNQSKDDKLLNMDTILMSINGTIGNLAWYNNERVMLGKSAAYLTVSNFDKKFIFSYLQTSTIKNYFLNNLTGTTIKNLGLKTIRDTTLFVPTLEEQQKIGSLFKQLDDTIALHQRKLDLLKEQKKGYLQKMFV